VTGGLTAASHGARGRTTADRPRVTTRGGTAAWSARCLGTRGVGKAHGDLGKARDDLGKARGADTEVTWRAGAWATRGVRRRAGGTRRRPAENVLRLSCLNA
jgi:hypothetical protein